MTSSRIDVTSDGDVTIVVQCGCAAALQAINERLSIMATQADVDAIVAAIQTATDGIRSDIQALKDAAAAGANLDFTQLDAKVAALAALDAENPEVVNQPPTV